MRYFLLDWERQRAVLLLSWLVWILFVPGIARSEQLPIKTYTTADGLAHNDVNRIVRDSRGFLWFCTEEGLSRFDGYRFTNYTTDQGLPHRVVTDLVEAPDGSYWLATYGGVCRFNPAGASLFTVYAPSEDRNSQKVFCLAVDQPGVIWCGTANGLYRLRAPDGQKQFELVEIGMPSADIGRWVLTVFADRHGSLWVGTIRGGLYRRFPDGRVEHYTTLQGLPDNGVAAVLEDHGGRIWIATRRGLCQLVDAPGPSSSPVARLYTVKDGLNADWISALFQSSDGRFWIGNDALTEFSISTQDAYLLRAGRNFRTYTTRNGLSSHVIQALAEDRDGNLWIGTDSGGVMKLARSGFTTYTEADGLAAPGIDAVLEDRTGELCAIGSGHTHPINRFDGTRFTPVWPDFPKRITDFGWGYNQVAFQDHAGEWWVPTGQGLCRFPTVRRVQELAHTPPKAIYTTREGLPGNDVTRLYEDSHGDIWISSASGVVTRWARATGTLHIFTEADGFVPLPNTGVLSAFAEDAAGNLWIAYAGGGLARYSSGRFTVYTEADGVPAGTIRAFYLDKAHRLWLAASAGGLARCDEPSEHPRFVTYTTADGVSSNDVWCVTEDQWGHIYVGTGRGLDRLDPQTGHIKHYTAADGLMKGKVTSAYRDSQGVLWFASNVGGLSRFVPTPDPPETAPPILISGLRVGGVSHPVSQLGETEVGGLDLGPGQNQLSIDFVALGFGPGEVLRYQYKLEGADRDWSQPSDQRSVNYANLAPGKYRFLVRAVNTEGLGSSEPATFRFTIAPPFWRRWWFALAVLSGIIAAAYSLHRARLRQVVAMERVRRQVATDLHDEMGSGLAQIAILSEVAKRETDRAAPGLLSEVADLARLMRDSMSDIVWAVDPRKDSLAELVQRMRQVTFNLLEVEGIPVEFDAPGEAECARINIAPDRRRHLHLLFKEAVTNTARHAQARRVHISLRSESGGLRLSIADDGRGFDPHKAHSGHGLGSLRQRAAELHGQLEIESSPGCGTEIRLTMPLR